MTEPTARDESAVRERVECEARRDPLAPARGILLALVIGGALWLALVLFLVFAIARN
jgi:hypothetical protein